jgi:hypothetical protein
LSNCHKYKLVNDVKLTKPIVSNDAVRNIDKLNIIKNDGRNTGNRWWQN